MCYRNVFLNACVFSIETFGKTTCIYVYIHILCINMYFQMYHRAPNRPLNMRPCDIHPVTTRYPTQNLPNNNKSSSGSMKCQKPSPCPEQNFWSIFGGFLGTDLGGLQNIVVYSILGMRPPSVHPLRFTLFCSLPPPMPPINRGHSPLWRSLEPLENDDQLWTKENIHADSWKSWKTSQKWCKKECYNTLIKAMFGCE